MASLVGTKVRKCFDGVYYDGEVVEFDEADVEFPYLVSFREAMQVSAEVDDKGVIYR